LFQRDKVKHQTSDEIKYSQNEILIPAGFVNGIETRIRTVVEFLKKYDYEATGLDILKLLYPIAGRFYRTLLERTDLNPLQR